MLRPVDTLTRERKPLTGLWPFRIDAVVGEHAWNFADFTRLSGTARVGGNKKRAFTRDRQPKAAAWALRRRWRGDDETAPSAGAATRATHGATATPVPTPPREAAQPAPAEEAGR